MQAFNLVCFLLLKSLLGTCNSAPKYQYIGCFVGTASRAIPGSGRVFHSGTAADRVKQCALLTASRGYNTFGVQYNGQCYTGSDVRRTYNKYGSGEGCYNGLGGAFRNSVYFLAPKHQHIGCFVDTAVRVIPHSGRNFYSGTPAYKIDQCALLTASRGYNTFGVQYTGQCYTGPDARRTYNKYGSGVGCRNGLGGAFRNSVYFLEPSTPRQCPILTTAPGDMNTALSNHVIETRFVRDLFECARRCFNLFYCVSFNFEFAAEKMKSCELNVSTKKLSQASVVKRPGFVYYG